MNWIVTVQTENSQIIDVPVKGYIQIKDAENAALGMTGAVKVLYAVPDYSSSTHSSGILPQQQTSNTNYDSDLNLLEGVLLLLSGIGIFASIVIPQLFSLTWVLLAIAIIHYIIRKAKDELF